MDLYELLGVEADVDERVIRKAFRRASLKYHPDKNPSADAVKKFHLLREAVDILLDDAKRKQYDATRIVKLQQDRRYKQKSAERQKMQADLERREEAAKLAKPTTGELDHLRSEGYRRRQELADYDEEDKRTVTINISATTSEEGLVRLMSKYGPVEQAVVGEKKAIVLFKTLSAAMEYRRKEPSKLVSKEYAEQTLERLRKVAANMPS